MSSKKETVIISPPDRWTAITEEKIESRGHVCTLCNGKGLFVEQIGYEQYEKTECSVCKGSGRIKAVIVISWIPD